MKIKQLFAIIISIILSIVLVFGLFPPKIALADAADELNLPEFPSVSSKYVVLMDADSGEVLYSSNPDAKCYPASTTKILTALLTIENCAPDDIVTYSKAAVGSIEYGDANASISVGEELTIEQSLYCLILRSANDVAYGLAEHVGGSILSFADMMNRRATEMGCTGTHFTNASGLSDEFHYTTPYDMALIAKNCFNNKSLMRIMSYPDVYVIGPTNINTFTRYYRHRYQMVAGGDFAYKYSMGGKTGYTDAAGSCLVSFAQKDDLRLVCVIMNSDDTGRYKDTAALFDYYFENYKKTYISDNSIGLSGQDIDILELTSRLDRVESLTVGFSDNAYLLVPQNVKMSDLTGIVTYANNPAYAGEKGGFACISYYYGNINVGSATIFVTSQEKNDALPGTNGVPKASLAKAVDKTNIYYLNIWYILGGAGLLALIIFIIVFSLTHRRHYPKYKTKKLRF